METLFKRYFWVINLLVIATAAYVLAATINEYVGDKVLAVPPASLSADSKGLTASSVVPKNPQAETMSADLTQRRAFNSDPLPEPDPIEDPVSQEDLNEEPEEEEGEIVECADLGVTLIGTMMTPNPGLSMATIDADGKSILIRIGSKVLDQADVTDIQRRYIRLDNGGEQCVIKLWAEEDASKKKSGRSPGEPRPKPTRHKPSPRVTQRTNYDEGVKKLGGNEYEISRAMLDENLEDLSQLGMQARIVPNYRGGKYEGFKLVGVRPNSLYRSIGIRSGDVVKRINGNEINSPNKAIQLFDSLKNKSNIVLDIERRGQLQSMNYTIK